MNLATLIIAALVFIPMGIIVYKQLKKAKNGETGCSCGCGGCNQAKKCQMSKDALETKKSDSL